MQELTAILEFRHVAMRAVSPQIAGLVDADFVLNRGELILVELEEGREHLPLASLAQGLLTPDSGTVRFLGEDWAGMSAARQSVLRGRIRRVYEHYGWVANLDVMENLCLAESHHTHRDLADIQKEIQGLARRFGVDPVPDARPARVNHLVLRKLEWVRALVGVPDLIVLERPLFGAPKADASRFLAAIREVTQRGIAVLWISDEPGVLDCRDLAVTRRFRMNGDNMEAV